MRTHLSSPSMSRTRHSAVLFVMTHPTRSLRLALFLSTSLALVACDTSTTVLRTSPDGSTSGTSECGTPMGDGGAGAGALPACTGVLLNRSGGFGPYTDAPLATVQARGEVTYTQVDVDDGGGPIELDAMLSGIDTVASSITLTSATGETEVFLRGIPLEWLDSVPLGGAVHARFQHGIVVTEATSGRPLLALQTIGAATHPSAGIDVGAMHFVQGSSRCIYTWLGFGGGGSTSDCYVGVVETGLDVTGASFLTPEQISLDGHLYQARVVESLRQGSFEEVTAATGGGVCAPFLETSFSIVVSATD